MKKHAITDTGRQLFTWRCNCNCYNTELYDDEKPHRAFKMLYCEGCERFTSIDELDLTNRVARADGLKRAAEIRNTQNRRANQ